uniref:Tropomyosin-like protein n=1 Tax=Ciona intestinalis TaxID=7719 RepID=Q9U759_CIOIN|nr:tropomyosin-like protein [Ciona intestinalis]
MENIKMKIAKLKAESDEKENQICDLSDQLKKVTEERKQFEEVNRSLSNKISTNDTDIERLELQNEELKRKSENAERELDEVQRELKKLQSEHTASAERCDDLTEELKLRKMDLDEVTTNYDDAIARIKVLDGDNCRLDDKVQALEDEAKQLRESGQDMDGILKALEAKETTYGNNEIQAEDQIRSLKMALEESECRREALENEAKKYQADIEKLELDLDKEMAEKEEAKAELDRVLSELGEM